MGSKSWGIELWDQTDNILKYSSDGITQLDQVQKCLNELSKLHLDAGKAHKRIVRNYQPKTAKVNRDIDECSYTKCFNAFLDEISKLTTAHEKLSELLKTEMSNELKLLSDDLRKRLDKQKTNSEKLSGEMRRKKQSLDNTFRKYRNHYKEYVRATEVYKKAADDRSISREIIDRHKLQQEAKRKDSDTAKADYADELAKFNQYQKDFYSKSIPNWASESELMDNIRLNKTREVMKRTAELGKNTCRDMEQRFEDVSKAVELINVERDSQVVISSFSTGNTYPCDEAFIDLETCNNGSMENLPDSAFIENSSTPTAPLKQGGSRLSTRKKSLFSIFSGKAPKDHDNTTMSKEQMRQRIDETKHTLTTAQKELDGLITLRDSYVGNPTMGDPQTIITNIDLSTRKIQSLSDQLKTLEQQQEASTTFVRKSFRGTSKAAKIKKQAKETSQKLIKSRSVTSLNDKTKMNGNGRGMDSCHNSPGSNTMGSRTVDSDEEFDSPPESPAANSFQNQHSAPYGVSSTPPNDVATSDLRSEGGGGTNNGDDTKLESQVKTYVGSCTAVYAFQSTDESDSDYLPMVENSQFYVLDLGDNSGWTLVETLDGSQQGYVPTSYLEIEYYDT